MALLAGAALAAAPQLAAQPHWAPAGIPGHVVGLLRHIYADQAGDAIYFAGAISFTGQSWQQSNSVMRYAHGQWDTLGVLNGMVNSVVMYNDTLVAGGDFWHSHGVPCEGIAYHDGTSWNSYGDLDRSVRMLRVLDGELYAVGGFGQADGQPASGVAKRVGGTWTPVGLFDLQASIVDVAKYNGNVIVIGGVDIDGGNGIAEWDGNAWHLLGPGLVGSFSSGQCLAVYQGDLYVGGQIAIAPGNPGQNIMRWDGNQFHALGQGIQWWLGNTSSIATVMEMAEHDGKLFVGGGYRAAGGIEALGLATWDGTEWCGVPGDFRASGGIWGMDFHHDTLFVACGLMLDGDTVDRAAKFIGEVYQTVCSGPVGVQEVVTPTFTLYPNPTNGLLHVEATAMRPRAWRLTDALGREVLHGRPPTTGPFVVDLSMLGSGLYHLVLEDAQGMRHARAVYRAP